MLDEALRLFRVYNDLKIRELAEQIGLSPSYISELENGRKTPNLGVIAKYSERFDVPSSSIIEFAEQLEANEKGIKARIAKGVFGFLRRVEQNAN